MAVLRFGGRSPQDTVKKNIQELVTMLKANKIQMKGEQVLMRYNAPYTLTFQIYERSIFILAISLLDKSCLLGLYSIFLNNGFFIKASLIKLPSI